MCVSRVCVARVCVCVCVCVYRRLLAHVGPLIDCLIHFVSGQTGAANNRAKKEHYTEGIELIDFVFG